MQTIETISIDEYHEHPAISRSMLLDFKKSPKHYWYKRLNPDYKPQASTEIITKRNALAFGNAVHTKVLEPDTWDQHYMLWEGQSRVTKAGKETFIAAKEKAGNRLLIDEEAYQLVNDMAKEVLSHEAVAALIEGTRIERSFFWLHPDTQLLLKARPDIWGQDYLADLKTVANASPKSFQKSVFDFGYHIQAAMQIDAVQALTGVAPNHFLFLVVEKEAPHVTAIYELDELAIAAGRDELNHLLSGVARCLKTDQWPGYQTSTITLPKWANLDPIMEM